MQWMQGQAASLWHVGRQHLRPSVSMADHLRSSKRRLNRMLVAFVRCCWSLQQLCGLARETGTPGTSCRQVPQQACLQRVQCSSSTGSHRGRDWRLA